MAESSGVREDSDDMCLDIDWGDPTGEEVRKKTLVGRVVSERNLNRGTVKNMIFKAWNMQKGLGITEIGENVFKFAFDREEDCRRIIRGSPWMILGCLLVLEKWKPMLTLEEVELKWSPYWIQLHGLPLEAFSVKNIIRIAGKFGRVLTVEDPFTEGKATRIFARAKVLFDISKPLLSGVSIPRPGLSKIWVAAKYEKLQQYCYNCGVIGHDQKFCKAGGGVKEPKMEGWMGTEPVRSLGKLILVEAHSQSRETRSREAPSREARGVQARGEGSQESVGTGTPMIGLQRLDGYASGSGMTAGKSFEKQLDRNLSAHEEIVVGSSVMVTPVKKSAGPIDFSLGPLEKMVEMGQNSSPRKFIRARRSPKKDKVMKEVSMVRPYYVEMPFDEEKEDHRALVVSKPRIYEADLANRIQQVCLKRKVGLQVEEQRKKIKPIEQREDDALMTELVKSGATDYEIGKVSPKEKSPSSRKKKVKQVSTKSKSFKEVAVKLFDVPISESRVGENINGGEVFVFSAESISEDGCGGWPNAATSAP